MTAGSAALPGGAALLRRLRRVQTLYAPVARQPLQLWCGLAAAYLLALSPRESVVFYNRGEWIAITVCLALDANVGATGRKAVLRAVGTMAGGGMGALIVYLTSVISNGWAASVVNYWRRVAALTLLSCSTCAVASYLRELHAYADYAYSVFHVTLVLTTLSSFNSRTLHLALMSILYRVVCIATGGALALAVSVFVLPEYASHAARATLASLLVDNATLLAAACEAHLAPAEAQPLPAETAQQAELEARVSVQLARLGALLAQAGEEELANRARKCRLRHPPDWLMAAGVGVEAAAAARRLFTGAVSLLHLAEGGNHQSRNAHAPAICAACAACAAALEQAAALAALAEPGCGGDAHAALACAEAAIAAAAGEVSVEAECEAARDPLDASRAGLAALCFALGDAVTQTGRLLALSCSAAKAAEVKAQPRPD